MVKARTGAWFAAPLLALSAALAFAPAAFGLPAGTLHMLEETTDSTPTPNEVAEEGYTFGVGADIDRATTSFEAGTSYVYTGKAIEPKFTVTVDGKVLRGTTDPEDATADFYYYFMENVAVGKGTKATMIPGIETGEGPHLELVTVDADSNPHVKVVCFNITQAPIKQATVKLPNQVYTGKKLKPAANVKFNGMTLQQGTDYTIKYKNNVKVGKAKVTITGKGMYKGTKTATFKIKKASINNAKFSSVKAKTYTGYAIKPNVTVKFKGKKLKKGSNYTIKYSKNVNAGVAKIKIKGKNNLKGSHTIEFVIKPRPISKAKLTMGTAMWTGGYVTPSTKLTYNGKQLKVGKDYTLRFANNVDVGTAKIYVYSWGNFAGHFVKEFYINPRPITDAYGVSANWVNSLTKEIVKNPQYTRGSNPKPTVTYKGRTLRYNASGYGDYTLTWSEPAGTTGTVTIHGTGSYTGTRTLTYKIL